MDFAENSRDTLLVERGTTISRAIVSHFDENNDGGGVGGRSAVGIGGAPGSGMTVSSSMSEGSPILNAFDKTTLSSSASSNNFILPGEGAMIQGLSTMMKLPRPSLTSSLQVTGFDECFSSSSSASINNLTTLSLGTNNNNNNGIQDGSDLLARGRRESFVFASPEAEFKDLVSKHGYLVSVNTAVDEYRRIFESKDFHCPICMHVIREAFMTKCGHSFCYSCLCKQLSCSQECPTCKEFIRRDLIYPNFLLNDLLERQLSLQKQQPKSVSHHDSSKVSVEIIDNLVADLLKQKDAIENGEKTMQDNLILDFLVRLKAKKADELAQIAKHLEMLDGDIEKITKGLPHENSANFATRSSSAISTPITPLEPQVPDQNFRGSRKRSFEEIYQNLSAATPELEKRLEKETVYLQKKRKISLHFDDLQNCYFGIRSSNNGAAAVGSLSCESPLEIFRQSISRCSKYGKLVSVASVKCGDILNVSSIISSIEFDRDEEYFATGGVARCIKIYNYSSLIDDNVDVHYPVQEISTANKLSCLSWNNYIRNTLVCSDYEGLISVWDVNTKTLTCSLEEHEKRAWSVDFCRPDPVKFASGSDDTRVKIWSMNLKSSVMTIDSKANVCCVQFHPTNANLLAFGSADHNLHYYDLRYANKHLGCYKGHKKAISYVRFMNKDEMFTASTDSTLKLWNVGSSSDSIHSYSGHLNERNFVGLSVFDDYIACGSETNTVYVYTKAVSSPIITYKFGTINPLTGDETTDDLNQFVSSVCWRKKSHNLMVANSQGTIKVLALSS